MVKPYPAKFGTVLGVASGNVEVYSSDYESADRDALPNRRAYRSYVDDIFMGYKWQCVEFARRWMYLNRGYIFDDVAMAYDIFLLDAVRRVSDETVLPLKSFRNGSKRHPEPGALLVWREGGEFELTGHVAIVAEVFADGIRIVEQNCENTKWPDGRHYSRELAATITPDGEYWIRCSYFDADILGWVIQTGNDSYAEPIAPLDTRLLNVYLATLPEMDLALNHWLNIANPDEAAYVRFMGGHYMTAEADLRMRFLCLSESALQDLKRATNELHALFMHATDYVLQNESVLERFNIPACLWEKIRNSWDNRRNHMITGRMDFSISDRGIKLYEYNADSSSCYLEAGKIQGKWSQNFECGIGVDSGGLLFHDLINAWKRSDIDGVLHIMQDKDLEETYHALFMKEALEAAGIRCKIITGVGSLSWSSGGDIVDSDGEAIKWVWKTWAWETALDQIRAECRDDPERLKHYVPGESRPDKPRLVDVLLRREVMVFEPLWTIIASNKAILPVLSEMFPTNKYLLHASFDRDEAFSASGYVVKPIVGRCGENVSLVNSDNTVLEKTTGRFTQQNEIYQTLWPLNKIGQYNVQLCTFTVDGYYSASCSRVDKQYVIRSESDVVPLRVVPDSFLLSHQLVGEQCDVAGNPV